LLSPLFDLESKLHNRTLLVSGEARRSDTGETFADAKLRLVKGAQQLRSAKLF
jgi:hypothetical protein